MASSQPARSIPLLFETQANVIAKTSTSLETHRFTKTNESLIISNERQLTSNQGICWSGLLYREPGKIQNVGEAKKALLTPRITPAALWIFKLTGIKNDNESMVYELAISFLFIYI